MLTFTQITSEVQSSVSNFSASELVIIKRDANRAVQRFKSVISRPWSRIAKKANIVQDQADYQLPKSVLRIMGASYKYGDSYFPLIEVGSEQYWERINATPSVSIGIPRFFFPKGKNIISVSPTPGSAVSEGLKIFYEPKQSKMEAADYTTGTITVTEGDSTITHSGAGFTPSMVGRYFYVTDETHGEAYQIVSYTDSSNMELENVYEGSSGAGKTFLIGCVPDIPDEYHDAIVDYCIGRFYKRQKDIKTADTFMDDFKDAIEECKEAYASPTSEDKIYNLQDVSMNLFDLPPNILS